MKTTTISYKALQELVISALLSPSGIAPDIFDHVVSIVPKDSMTHILLEEANRIRDEKQQSFVPRSMADDVYRLREGQISGLLWTKPLKDENPHKDA